MPHSLVFMEPTKKGVCDPASCAIMGSTTGMVASCPTLEVNVEHWLVTPMHKFAGACGSYAHASEMSGSDVSDPATRIVLCAFANTCWQCEPVM